MHRNQLVFVAYFWNDQLTIRKALDTAARARGLRPDRDWDHRELDITLAHMPLGSRASADITAIRNRLVRDAYRTFMTMLDEHGEIPLILAPVQTPLSGNLMPPSQ